MIHKEDSPASILSVNTQVPYSPPKVFFPGLNALRFFAAALVVVCHTEQQKEFWGLTNYRSLIPPSIASSAVTFFFVLSGFLITFLLFKEKDKSGSIGIKNFYFRRILRIWPVYYLVIILAFVILPNLTIFYIPGLTNSVNQNFPNNFIFYLLFLPNIGHLLNLSVVYATQLWSIGVEEQFYLIWPVLIKKSTNYLRLLLIIILIFFLSRNAAAFLSHNLSSASVSQAMTKINEFLIMTRIGSMAIGGLGAYYIYNNNSLFRALLINRVMEVLTVLVILLFGYKSVYIPYINIEIYALLFCILIVNISCNPNSIFKLENSFWAKLGDISYGIYMYHLIAIGIVLFTMKQVNMQRFNFYENLLLHVSSQLLTYAIAYFSFKYFEKPFLSLKQKFVIIKSGS